MPRCPAIVVCLVLACLPWPAARAQGDVTIYRCIDGKGKLTLRDTPCAKGQTQQTRSMLRPKDAPPRPPATRTVPAERVDGRPRVVVAYPPQPLYECTTPDGERYTSETNDGNPRWVPLWTLGYPVYPIAPRQHSGVDFRVSGRNVEISGGRRIDYGPVLPPAAYGAGTWIQDRCQTLPQGEACDRLVDRRDEIRRRFFNAMPSERDVLRIEERGINARLDNDCGAH